MRVENKVIVFEGKEDIRGATGYIGSNGELILKFIANPQDFNGNGIYAIGRLPILGSKIAIICLSNNGSYNIIIHPEVEKLFEWMVSNPIYTDMVEIIKNQIGSIRFKAPKPTNNSKEVNTFYDREGMVFLKNWLESSKEAFVAMVKYLLNSDTTGLLAARSNKDSGEVEYIAIFRIGERVTKVELLSIMVIKAYQPITLKQAVMDADLSSDQKEEFNAKLSEYFQDVD